MSCTEQGTMTKRLILICGPNGVGKSTACRALLEALDGAAYVDSDWCRAIHPFAFDAETLPLIRVNLAALLGNYLQSARIQDVIWQYGLHGPRQQILEGVLADLSGQGIAYRLCPIVLTCALEENVRRMQADGRDAARIARAVRNTRELYASSGYPTVDTTWLSVPQTVAAIVELLSEHYRR